MLAFSLALLILSFFPAFFGVSTPNTLEKRLFFAYFHANFFHAILNIFCLLQLAFYYRVSWLNFLAAYVISCTTPSALIDNTLGASGIIFALLGIYTLKMARSWVILLYVAIMSGLTAFIGNVNTWLHVYCYVIGLLLSCITTTKKWWLWIKR